MTEIRTASELDALPVGSVVRSDGEVYERIKPDQRVNGGTETWRALHDARGYREWETYTADIVLGQGTPVTVLFRPDAPQPATGDGGEVTPERAVKYLLSDEDADAWDTAPLAVRGDLSHWPHPLRWSAEHGRPYVAGLPLDEVLSHWFEHVANTAEPDEADPAVVSADYTRLRAALAAARAGEAEGCEVCGRPDDGNCNCPLLSPHAQRGREIAARTCAILQQLRGGDIEQEYIAHAISASGDVP